jgi:hypothetical protein
MNSDITDQTSMKAPQTTHLVRAMKWQNGKNSSADTRVRLSEYLNTIADTLKRPYYSMQYTTPDPRALSKHTTRDLCGVSMILSRET